jgi:hypothetical protein
MEEEIRMFTRKSVKIIAIIISVAIKALILLGMVISNANAAPERQEPGDREGDVYDDPGYIDAIQRTAAMASDSQAQSLAAEHGLNVMNVMWEDTGRYKNSAVGPNISDVTIQVMYRDPNTEQYQLSLMPVIRYPNFSDKTADIPLDHFYLLIGNEKGEA